MKYAWLGCLLLLGSLLSAGTQDSEFNVNTRYTVETVVISTEGWTTDLVADHDKNGRLSSGFRKDAAALIGEKLNPTMPGRRSAAHPKGVPRAHRRASRAAR